MSQSLRPRRRAPYELLARPSSRSLWAHLHRATATSTKVATVFGAAVGDQAQVSVWYSDPPEAARLAATGQAPRPRSGLRGLLSGRSGQVVVTRRDLHDSDVVIATLLALHPASASQWDADALPADVVEMVARAAITRQRPDGSTWRTMTQADSDAVATLLCTMDELRRRDHAVDDLLRDIARNLPDDVTGVHAALDRLPDVQTSAA